MKTRKLTYQRPKNGEHVTVTSGTIFHGRKLSFKKIMLGTLLYVNGVGGKAALQLRRDLRCNQKTAWLLGHRLREAMTSYVTGRRLTAEFESVSAAIGGKVRKANRAVDRKKQPRRHNEKVTELSVLREPGRNGRIVPFLGNESALVKVIGTLVDAELIVDEHPAWTNLFNQYTVRQIKHKDEYSDLNGTSTNLAESYWSRFKWIYNGTYRHFSGRYAQAYNGECAWREEHRRQSNGRLLILATAGALHHPP